MILLDSPTISPERQTLLDSAIMATIETDKVRAIFCSGSEGKDLTLIDFVDAQGQHYALGRVRIHVDQKTFGSLDERIPLRIVGSARIPAVEWDSYVIRALLVFCMLHGLDGPMLCDLRAAPLAGQAFHDRFMAFLEECGANISMATFSEPADSSTL